MKRRSVAHWIAFADLLLCAFFFMLWQNRLHELEAHQKVKEALQTDGVTAGRMCATLYWDGDRNVDIDLWGRGPDGEIIGYSRKSGHLMDLLRDDLGGDGFSSGGKNFEIMCTKQLRKGGWTFNAHYYANRDKKPGPINLRLVVSFPIGDDKIAHQPNIEKTVMIAQEGMELTLSDFELDVGGQVIRSTINDVYQPLRSYRGPT